MKKIIILITFFFMLASAFAADWKIVDTVYFKPDQPLRVVYEAIDCFDILNCVAVLNMNGKWPWNRKTTDGGRTWTTTLKDTLRWIYDDDGNFLGSYKPAKAIEIAYPSENLCIVVCDTGYYWRSSDNCKTWTRHKLDTRKPLRKISFADNRYGGICCFNGIYLTKDGGDTWQKTEFNLPDSIPDKGFVDLKVFDDKTVYVFSYDSDSKTRYFFKTNDFGKNWNYRECLITTTIKMFFLDKNEGWISGGPQVEPYSSNFRSTIYHTKDAGETWELQLDTLAEDFHKFPLSQIYFSDKNNGVAMGRWYTFYRTMDGGKNWNMDTSINTNNFIDYFWDIAFFGHDLIYALTETRPFIYKLSDEFSPVREEPGTKEKIEILSGLIYPNPSRRGENVRFGFELRAGGLLEMALYDIRGNEIENWPSKLFASGYYEVELDMSGAVTTGEYLLRVFYEGRGVATEKIVVE